MNLKIEKNVPIPLNRVSWPFPDMKVGDSVFIDDPGLTPKARMAAYAYAKTSKRSFTTRTMDGGVRVWRTK